MSSVVELDGLKVQYRRDCNTSEPKATLLFLHGWGGSSSLWESNIRELRNHFDCIALDFPGFGISGNPKDTWGVAEYAFFIKSFAESLGLRKFVLIGKSFGGRVGIYYASKWPETLSNLILVSSAGVEQPSYLTNAKVWLATIGRSFIAKVFPAFEPFARKIFYNALGVKRDESDYKWVVKKLVTRTDLSAEAKHINVPTLIIWGRDDKILHIEVGKRLNNLIEGSKLIIIQGGHNAHLESAVEFNSVVLKYLA